MSQSIKCNQEYTKEFMDEAVELAGIGDQSVAQIARNLGIPSSTLYGWINKAKTSKTPNQARRASGESKRISELEKELKQLKLERDILKKAMGYFANPKL